MGAYLSIDETTLSQGELYTIITNKEARGKQGSLVAMIRGTKADEVIFFLNKLSHSLRLKVKEITLDLSPVMQRICKSCFPNAELVSDRFHVQRLMNEAISDMRIDHRWEAIELENKEIAFAKELGKKYNPFTFKNGDTRRQLLARSRHIIMKHYTKWTDNQRIRAEILFREYPDLEEAYQISMELTQIYNTTQSKGVGLTKLAHWYNKVERLNLKFFKSVIYTMQNNYDTISNYFIRRATNASAESFNAKIKAFRAQFRGVQDIPFFIFRLEKLFA
jgi:transposase